MNQKKITFPFFYWFFKLKKQRKQIITLRDKKGHQLTIKHSENIQKRILTTTSELGSQPPLNNHRFNFDKIQFLHHPSKFQEPKMNKVP